MSYTRTPEELRLADIEADNWNRKRSRRDIRELRYRILVLEGQMKGVEATIGCQMPHVCPVCHGAGRVWNHPTLDCPDREVACACENGTVWDDTETVVEVPFADEE